MKKTVLLACMLTALLAAGIAEPIVFYTGEWEPFTGSQLPNKGIATEIVIEACKAAGIESKFEFVPWTRAENMVANGTAFGTYPYAKNDERAAKYYFSEVMLYTSTGFVYYEPKKNLSNVSIQNWTALKPYSLIYLTGSWLENDIKANGIAVTLVNDLDSAVRMLYAGRSDMICEEPVAVLSAVKKLYPNEADKFKVINTNMFGGKNPVFLMVSKTYPGARELLAKFNGGLATIRANGVLKGIASKYGITID